MKGVQPAKEIVLVIVWVVASKHVLDLAMTHVVTLVPVVVDRIAQEIVVAYAKVVAK